MECFINTSLNLKTYIFFFDDFFGDFYGSEESKISKQ